MPEMVARMGKGRVVVWAGLALLVSVAALLLAAPVSAHDLTPGYPGEALGDKWVTAPIPPWPGCWAQSPTSPLNAIPFIGPPGTCIEDQPCPGIADVDIPTYGAPNQHIGHISQVMGAMGETLAQDSVDLWHFWASDQGAPVENPHNIEMGAQSIMMGPDGFFRGRFANTISENTAAG
ncbi:MAG: hypothetical protein ABR562_07875, partial [Thermoplasmatota archaeon]